MSGPPSSLNAQLPRPGDIVDGKYVIESLIGQGGMGAVFKAKHRVTGGVRAVKVMLAEANNPEAKTRFINEARAASGIQNEHVVRVDDVGEELGYAFMVLELLTGEDLAQILDREKMPMPPHLAVTYVVQALRGVAEAHALGIVHRDLKPSNLFLTSRSDGAKIVKVLDFGISKASNASGLNQSPSALTSTKAMLGSPLYMSPEQLRSSKSVDQRADIWAIGVILFELLTLSLPFMGDNLGELFAAILETDHPPAIGSRVQGVSPGLDAVVMRCLKRRPEERFQNARELIDALTPYTHPGAAAGAGAGAGLHNATAFMQPSPAYQPSPVTPTGPHAPVGFAQTPPPGRPMPPQPGAVTGGGSAPRGIPGQPGTVAMAATPGAGGLHHPGFPAASTNSSWQAEPVVPTNKPPYALIGIGAGVLVVAAIAGGVLAMRSGPKTDPTTAHSAPPSSSIAAPIPTPTPTPTETAVVPTPSTSTSATTTAVAATAATAQPIVPAGHNTGAATKPQPVVKTPDPPKTADPPKTPDVPKPASTPTAKPAGVGVQTR